MTSAVQLRVTHDALVAELEWRQAAASLTLGPPDPEIARRHLLEFVRFGHPSYLAGWFHRELCYELERFSREVRAGLSPRLLIAAPPRHGKSEIVSRRWPVWHLGRNPTHELVVASYGQDLANDMSRDARSIRNEVVDWWPDLAPGNRDGVEHWRTAGGGSYMAVGAGGPLTGRGAHCFPAGTQVSIPGGSIAIELIKPGDPVWTYDKSRGTFQSVVTATLERSSDDFTEVRFASGRVVRSTPEHRFFVPGRGYTEAQDLRVGDPAIVTKVPHEAGHPGQGRPGEHDHDLLHLPLQAPQVEGDSVSMVRRIRGEREPVYDIEVAGSHCFFAGGVLVHNCLILDDPFKNYEEASSQVIRESRWHWYTSTAYTRLAPGGGVLVMATRWHHDDLSGRLLEQLRAGDENWRVVSYPAIAEQDEPFRKAGEALHPERYPLAQLEQIRVVLGSRVFAALYQQRPTPETGGLFQRAWLARRFTHDPQRPPKPYTEIVISADLAFKESKTSDYVAMQAWGRYGWTEYHLLDEIHDRMEYVGTKAALRDFVKKWRPNAVLVEEKANGSAILSDLKSEIPGIVAFQPDRFGNKTSRAQLATPIFEAGQVALATAEWVGDYVEELVAFPAGTNDDRVDATSQVHIWWKEKRGGTHDEAAFNAGMAGVLKAFGG